MPIRCVSAQCDTCWTAVPFTSNFTCRPRRTSRYENGWNGSIDIDTEGNGDAVTRKKSATELRADAADLRKLAAEMLVKAARFEREANAMRDEPRELAAWWFEWTRQVRRAH